MKKRKQNGEDKEALTAKSVWNEYEQGRDYMNRPLWGNESLYDRVNLNNQFYEGDHWKDFNNTEEGSELPIFNICKQVGTAQVAIVASNVLTACYSWEDVPSAEEDHMLSQGGVPQSGMVGMLGAAAQQEPQTAAELAGYLHQVPKGQGDKPSNEEMRAVALMLSKYFRTFSNRCNLNYLVKQCVTDAYKNGTGLLYFYWDTNLRTMGAHGDIAVESVEIINLHCGDPTIKKIQEQPYLILETRQSLDKVRRMAEETAGKEAAEKIKADETESAYGDNHEIDRDKTNKNAKCTVLTRFWKEIENGKAKVYFQKSTKDVILKEKTDSKLSVYPIAFMPYEQKRGTIYAHTPLTEMIPNQRVANTLRFNQVVSDSYTAQPTLLYDESKMPDGFTNEIGAQIPVQGNINDAARYLQGQGMAASSENLAQVFMNDTLDINNVNAAVRGDLNPDNTSAIIALRDAAKMPMQLTSANLYMMFEDVARIVADFIMGFYGERNLRIEEKGESYVIPFRASRYKEYTMAVRVDVGESTLWSETATIRTLDNLLINQKITTRQYLERVPDGYVPMKQELINEIKAEEEAQRQAMMAQQAAASAAEATPQSAPVDWSSILGGMSDEELAALQDDPTAMRELSDITAAQGI